MTPCTHLLSSIDTPARSAGCEDCLALGDRWIRLRRCLECGYIGCCDSSKNKHASQHYRQTGHPVVQSFEPNETWRWCYVDQRMDARSPEERAARSEQTAQP